jgi:FkbM family methyltransferase
MEESAIGYLQSELQLIKRKLYAQEAIDRLGIKGSLPSRYPEFRSQFGEDMLAWDMLGNEIHGTYLEVGGFDGRSLSVTYALDAMGWNGLLIEPIKARFEESLKNRPNAIQQNYLLGKRGCGGKAELQVVEGLEMFSGASGNKIDFEPAKEKPIRIESVLTTDLDSALVEAFPDNVQLDLAVIDVEGSECDVLDGFSLDVWKPRVIIIEDNSFGRDDSMNKYFGDYQLYGILACNRVYGLRSDPQVWRFMNPTA